MCNVHGNKNRISVYSALRKEQNYEIFTIMGIAFLSLVLKLPHLVHRSIILSPKCIQTVRLLWFYGFTNEVIFKKKL